MKNRATGIVSALLLITATANAFAADEKASEPTATRNTAEAGLRVYVDPQSGELVSQPVTPEQRRQAANADAAFNQDTSDLVPVKMPDGSTMVDLQGRFQQATVATVQADGNIRTYCDDADHLALGTHVHDAQKGATPVSPLPATAREER